MKFEPGNYLEPLVLAGKVGTQSKPIFLSPDCIENRGKVVFKSCMSQKQAKSWANKVAYKREKAGYYPSIGQTGDQATLILRNCQFVIIQGLDFEDCWPTAIYLDDCQNVLIHDCRFRRGTIAIGLNGTNTHDIVIQDCHWQQDTTGTDMWDKVPWGRIHGASDNLDNPGVDIKGDYRHWDGDFIRGWNVGQNITIRRNKVTDAFNGIHFFNSKDRLAPGVDANVLSFNSGRRSTANFLIENNEFERIRDNIFEPEDHAWNWVIRHNKLKDFYRPFSFEFQRAGWIYVYGNTGTFVNTPSEKMSPEDNKKFPTAGSRRNKPSIFKPKGVQANEGPIVVAFNSWFIKKGKGVLPKFALGNLVHANNAFDTKRPDKGLFFGNNGSKPWPKQGDTAAEEKAEEGRFTRRWDHYNIRIDGDVIHDDNFPNIYRYRDYKLGANCVGANPGFANPAGTGSCDPDFSSESSKMVGQSIEIIFSLPSGKMITIPAGHNRGAIQPENTYDAFDAQFDFLPENDWLPGNIYDPRPFPESCTTGNSV